MNLNNDNIIVKGNNVKYITFRRFNELGFLKHCFSTRVGGVSNSYYESLNLGFSTNDLPENIRENYIRLFNECDFNFDNIVLSQQIHKTHIEVIDEKLLNKLPKDDLWKRRLNNCDGLITDLKNVPLVTSYADCVPLYFVDIKKKIIGLSHSGWRGTVDLMGMKTLEKMHREFDCNMSDIICAIGPSICMDCYEVSADVIDALTTAFNKNSILISNKLFKKKDDNKYQLNLWEANKLIIKKAGVNPENIILSEICTCHNNKYLFSHRAQNGKRGNMVAVMELV